MKTLPQALQEEIERCTEALSYYKQIIPEGLWAASMIEGDLVVAKEALIGGDAIEMIQSLKTLQSIKE